MKRAKFLEILRTLEAASGEGACWIWPLGKDSSGYGKVWIDKKHQKAHRLAFEAKAGPIPAGKLLCHHCDTPACVNPQHLYAGTMKDNMRDMVARGRASHQRHPDLIRAAGHLGGIKSRGAAHPNAKLTNEQVLAIRRDPRPQVEIAASYGMSRFAINGIKRGRRWRSLKEREA